MSEIAEFAKERGGAVVATILETDSTIVEVQRLDGGKHNLIVHNRIGETDRWDDMTAMLDRKHFEMLGSIAQRDGHDGHAPIATHEDYDARLKQIVERATPHFTRFVDELLTTVKEGRDADLNKVLLKKIGEHAVNQAMAALCSRADELGELFAAEKL